MAFSTKLTLAASLFVFAPALYANQADVQAEIRALKLQLQDISARLQQLEASQGMQAPYDSRSQPETMIIERDETPAVTVYGLLEIEAGYSDNQQGSSSDLGVATVELGLDAQLTRNINATVTALYEEDATDLEIDQATLTLADLAGSGVSLSLGQTYVPFGNFETNLVNDTLILELAETRETAAMLSWEYQGFNVSAYTFNGDIDHGGDTLESLGVSLGWSNDGFSFGADYISNILDSDSLSAALAEDISEAGLDLSNIEDRAGAFILQATARLANLMLIAEYVDSERFSIGSFSERELQAVHLEAATDIGPWTLALSWQETDNAANLLPQERLSLGASTSINDSLGIGLEYWRDQDYSGRDADNLLLQLNAHF
ncbi:porin [Pseudomaricurvus alcaniphilus]|uniref:LbtU family siderophore porin n=1 Tax=Pseudomaricurvus alcaniphilus TaxID=1166482 RepID=UPI00140B04B1|nr:LbtU family siderophore porin [Pseudomaricurvus alcaniphilus]NHN36041.1 porin [Pseudomaricurvus alcaniphilus]